MSDMNGNPHYWNLSRGYTTEERSDADTCQVEATLALAYEQRTAAMVAFYSTIPDGPLDEATRRLREDILARLGLEQP